MCDIFILIHLIQKGCFIWPKGACGPNRVCMLNLPEVCCSYKPLPDFCARWSLKTWILSETCKHCLWRDTNGFVRLSASMVIISKWRKKKTVGALLVWSWPLSGSLSWKMLGLAGSSGSTTIHPVTDTFLQGLDLYCANTRLHQIQDKDVCAEQIWAFSSCLCAHFVLDITSIIYKNRHFKCNKPPQILLTPEHASESQCPCWKHREPAVALTVTPITFMAVCQSSVS